MCTGGWDFLRGYKLFVISSQTIFRAAKGARWCSQDATIVIPVISSWREKQRKSFILGLSRKWRGLCVFGGKGDLRVGAHRFLWLWLSLVLK